MTDESQETLDRIAALERGLAAAVERIERLEGEVLPREPAADLGFDDLERSP